MSAWTKHLTRITALLAVPVILACDGSPTGPTVSGALVGGSEEEPVVTTPSGREQQPEETQPTWRIRR